MINSHRAAPSTRSGGDSDRATGPWRWGATVAVVLLLMVTAACSSSGPSATKFATATFRTQGSVGQVAVTDAAPGTALTLVDDSDKKIASGTADTLGSFLFRDVKPGDDYRVQTTGPTPVQSAEVDVMTDRPAPPDTSIYDQKLPTGYDSAGKPLKDGGYGYLTTRDGTKLAINVRMPGPPEKGPYPTVVEYSGYAYARPGAAESSLSPVWNILGYTVVDVNMRGTGCSGGAFDFFETLQNLDGYDAIETVARQPWTMNHQVGMVGISYGGISQLFVAQTNPPHLAAITPSSTFEGVMTTLRPGAILNTGFALTWAKDRVRDSKPSSATTGQKWAWKRIKGGDTVCKNNQKMHDQAVDLIKTIEENTTYTPGLVDPLTPSVFVHKIKMPTYLACQWQDEQTGGACPFLTDKFTGTDKAWFTYTNGTHVDSIDPATLVRAYDFLELYVAKRKPNIDPYRPIVPVIYQSQLGIGGVELPEDPIQQEPTYKAALAAFEKLPRIRVLFDNGRGGSTPGAPVPGFEHSFNKLPTKGVPYYLGPDGSLSTTKPTTAGSNSFIWDPGARPSRTLHPEDISDVWTALPPYNWTPPVAGKALSYVTKPLKKNVVMVGGGAMDFWVQSSEPDTDFQVTISEVRPDGQEVFVQNGWLRASYRKLNPKRSTELTPYPWARKQDLAPLPKGKWARVQIPIYAQGHAYRAGSRIRVTVAAPGGDQPQWAFDVLKPKAQVTDSVAFSPTMPSRVILPVVPGVDVPTPLDPSCRGLRGEPCRAYSDFTNSPGPDVG